MRKHLNNNIYEFQVKQTLQLQLVLNLSHIYTIFNCIKSVENRR